MTPLALAFSNPDDSQASKPCRLEPADRAKRDRAIRDLARQCGWTREELGDLFGLHFRHVNRITSRRRTPRDEARNPGPKLSRREIQAMARDYAHDPYLSAEDKAAALDYLGKGCPLVPG